MQRGAKRREEMRGDTREEVVQLYRLIIGVAQRAGRMRMRMAWTFWMTLVHVRPPGLLDRPPPRAFCSGGIGW